MALIQTYIKQTEVTCIDHLAISKENKHDVGLNVFSNIVSQERWRQMVSLDISFDRIATEVLQISSILS